MAYYGKFGKIFILTNSHRVVNTYKFKEKQNKKINFERDLTKNEITKGTSLLHSNLVNFLLQQ